MSTKIIEWSRRRNHGSSAGRHATRWYSALAPNIPASAAA